MSILKGAASGSRGKASRSVDREAATVAAGQEVMGTIPSNELLGQWRGNTTSDRFDGNPEIHSLQRSGGANWAVVATVYSSRIPRLPPICFPGQESMNHFLLGFIGDRMISSEYDYTLPLLRGYDLISLQADQRIGAHPRDLLTNCREGVNIMPFNTEIDRNDVGLGALSTREFAKANAR
jgi:hypothetical protein